MKEDFKGRKEEEGEGKRREEGGREGKKGGEGNVAIDLPPSHDFILSVSQYIRIISSYLFVFIVGILPVRNFVTGEDDPPSMPRTCMRRKNEHRQ